MSSGQMRCSVKAVGAWGQNYTSWVELTELLSKGSTAENTSTSPKPEIIPANERRRAPLPVKLAVESSWQATQTAGIDPKELACVFVSGLGDTQLTDYMCKTLASENMQLSPTKFHNSVHNAAAGYWTISTGCMKAANSVAGFNESVSLALFEAFCQCIEENAPVLIAFYDSPVSEILKPLLKNDQSFSAAIIIEPSTSDDDNNILEMSVTSVSSDWPKLQLEANLHESYEKNPSARILSVLKLLADNSKDSISLPLSAETSIQLTLNNANF